MAKVSVTLKVFPEDPGQLEKVKGAVSGIVEVIESKEEEIGFGVKALIVRFLMDDSGGIDAVEEKIAAVEGVSQVQVINVDRAEL